MDEKFIKQLLSKMKCGVCGRSCEPANISVLGHREDLWFLAVYCPSCSSRGFVSAVIKEGEIREAVTDLTEAEKNNFSTPVGSDDLIDTHTFLKDFKGDFSSLFSEK